MFTLYCSELRGNETIMIDFPYVPPSEMGKKEKARAERPCADKGLPDGSVTEDGGAADGS